jgi:Arc/MetJ-type ribon-helix-helix transcriptional regulator
MPLTPRTTVRLSTDLLDSARQTLDLPGDTSVSQVIRAALQRLTDPAATGEPTHRGRPPKART